MVRTQMMIGIAPALALVVLSGCRSGPSREELARLREEARAEDARLRGRDAGVLEPWSVELRTDTPGVRRVYSSEELDARANEEITTVGPSAGSAFTTPHKFRGVRLSRLVEGADAGADREVTLLGADGYYTTLGWDDVMRFPILVAVARDGAPIARAEGGPALVALPLSLDSDLAARYGENGFCFYVTGIAVGRPRPRVEVNGKVREPAELAGAGMQHRRQAVRFRGGWGAGEVAVDGPRLADVVGRKDRPVRVSAFGRPRGDAITITPEELASCDPLLVIGPSPTISPLPTRVGGPVLLAPLASCAAPWATRPWVAFVDAIETLEAAGAAGATDASGAAP